MQCFSYKTQSIILFRADPNMLKILPISYVFVPELPKNLTHYSYLFPHHHLLAIPTYSCYFNCIGDNNVHNTHSDYYTSEYRILLVQTFLQNLHEILLRTFMDIMHLHHHHHL